jgi:hypothetical protein
MMDLASPQFAGGALAGGAMVASKENALREHS